MRETRTFQIGDCKYRVKALGAKKALRILHILSRVTAPAMAGVTDLDEDLGERFGTVLDRLKEDDLDLIVETMAKETEVLERPDGGGVTLNLADIYDDHFAGKRLGDMLRWLVECLKLNFADFLAGLGSQFQGMASSKELQEVLGSRNG